MAKKMKICLDAGHNGSYNQSPVVPEYGVYMADGHASILLKDGKEQGV